ncbi:MAG: transglutaminase family protein [Pirellulaceae bacterium]
MAALSFQAKVQRGISSPVIVPAKIDWERDYSRTTLGELVAMSDDELATVDPLAMNLIVARDIPALEGLDVGHYQEILNDLVLDFSRRCLPGWEAAFHEAPQDFENDIRYFRLGMVCQYLELEVGIEYKRDQRDIDRILYTNPADLFLNGVFDTHEGTCGSLAALNVAFGWRMGWPVSLACENSHYLLRYDDGETIYNIEATTSGRGGFGSDTDEDIIRKRGLRETAIACGSDLRALRPREMLGTFVGMRARHFQDLGKQACREDLILASEPDWLLARHLFPTNRAIYKHQVVVSAMRGDALFDSDEAGHPSTFAGCLDEIRRSRKKPGYSRATAPQTEACKFPADAIDEFFSALEI